MSNRITAAIERTKTRVTERLASGQTTKEQVEKLHKTLDMDAGEHARFQTLKSAVMGSKLTFDEAQLLYVYLGETPNTFNAQPVEVKSVLTQVFTELLAANMGRSERAV